MILKANRRRAFLKTFAIYFPLILVLGAFTGFTDGKSFDPWGLLGLGILGASVFGLAAALAQTPREIRWDDENFSIRSLLPASGEYPWDQLVSYSPLGYRQFGLFVIKFQSGMAYGILPVGFDEENWNELQQFLRQKYPEKTGRTWF